MDKAQRLANDPVFLEPLQHLHMCKRYYGAFQVGTRGGTGRNRRGVLDPKYMFSILTGHLIPI